MKYLHTYNESLRDKMVGKSDKEILVKYLEKDDLLGLLNDSIKNEFLKGFDVALKIINTLHDERSKKEWLGIALKKSVAHKRLEYVKRSIESGADINVDLGKPLLVACTMGYVDIVEYLLKNGADPHVRHDEAIEDCEANSTIPDKEAAKEYKRILKLLKHYGNITESLRDKMTPKEGAEEKYNDIIDSFISKSVRHGYFDTDQEAKDFFYSESYRDLIDEMIITMGLSPNGVYNSMISNHLDEWLDIIGEPPRYKVHESLRDKMTPKPDKEVDDKLDELYEYLIKMSMEDGIFKSMRDAEAYIEYSWESIIQLVFEEGWSKEDVYDGFEDDMRMKSGVYESLRNKMTPKSKKEINQSIDKIFRYFHNRTLEKWTDDEKLIDEFWDFHRSNIIDLLLTGWSKEEVYDEYLHELENIFTNDEEDEEDDYYKSYNQPF